jgi:hypothetical protein
MSELTENEILTLKRLVEIFDHVEKAGSDAQFMVQETYERECRMSGGYATPELETNRTMRVANVRNVMLNMIAALLLPKLPAPMEPTAPEPAPRKPVLDPHLWWKQQGLT